MSNDITVQQVNVQNVLKTSLYPGASDSSISMVLDYCRAAGLDPLQKPVHIVPMWDKTTGQMRDVIMPGIGLYRTQASRSDEYAGITEPEFGPDVTENIGGHDITYPLWCKITVKRKGKDGAVYDFTAKEFWKENYALKGGKDRSIAPNAMWARRPYGQIAKCSEAQALRKAFPELGSQPTAEEMEGKTIGVEEIVQIEIINEEQLSILNKKIADAAASDQQFLLHFKISSLEELPVQAYDEAIFLLEKKIDIRKKKQAETLKKEEDSDAGT